MASLISEVKADSCRASSTFSAATMGSGRAALLLLFDEERPFSLLRDRFKLGEEGMEAATSVATATDEATEAAVVAEIGAGRPRAAAAAVAGERPGEVVPEVLRAIGGGKPPPED
jgi:hypothetical protein